MDRLNTLLILADVLDPTVVLAIWFLACLAALGIGLITAWAIQIEGDGDIWARRTWPNRYADLFTAAGRGPRHSAKFDEGQLDKTRWQPMHTAAAVARRGRHHPGDRTSPVAYLLENTQDLTRRTLPTFMDGA